MRMTIECQLLRHNMCAAATYYNEFLAILSASFGMRSISDWRGEVTIFHNEAEVFPSSCIRDV